MGVPVERARTAITSCFNGIDTSCFNGIDATGIFACTAALIVLRFCGATVTHHDRLPPLLWGTIVTKGGRFQKGGGVVSHVMAVVGFEAKQEPAIRQV